MLQQWSGESFDRTCRDTDVPGCLYLNLRPPRRVPATSRLFIFLPRMFQATFQWDWVSHSREDRLL